MVIIAAALLSLAAVLLKPFQERNMAIEKMGGILASAEVEGVETNNTIDLFNKYIVEELVVDKAGDAEPYKEGKMEDGPAFKIDMKKELYKKSKGEDFHLPVYVVEKDGKTIYVLPLRGTGLWGPIWGNIALQDDLNTVVGVTFDHKGETPGLGAEITTMAFCEQFVDKTIFDKEGNFKSIIVKKGGAKTLPQNMQIHGVDAISGGTITSDAVTSMINDVLSAYLPYIQKQRAQ
jgi:Na+-transporting NADH:ubiquinone oxidoreductase subunit C